MAAADQRIRDWPSERSFDCIGLPMARHRLCPTQRFLTAARADYFLESCGCRIPD
jgi:hypothetical protein